MSIARRLFGADPGTELFDRRGFFPGDPDARRELERVGRTFLRGYHAALEGRDEGGLVGRLEAEPAPLRGFAYEGATMGLGVLDAITPWNRGRFGRFVKGPGLKHAYTAYVGLGWAVALLRLHVGRARRRLDPLLGWLAVDGYGFYQGYFHWPRFVARQAAPRGLTGYEHRAFDQGLGRSLWFLECADAGRVAARVRAFPPARRADLWGGVGLACAYAGPADAATARRLRDAARENFPALAQGAAFAAEARARAGNLTGHTQLVCGEWCGRSAGEAAELTGESLAGLPSDGLVPAYEAWRERVQSSLRGSKLLLK